MREDVTVKYSKAGVCAIYYRDKWIGTIECFWNNNGEWLWKIQDCSYKMARPHDRNVYKPYEDLIEYMIDDALIYSL